jgi:hypothetical protein
VNLLKYCNIGLGKNMRKDARPSGGINSSNPRRCRGGGSTTMVMVFVR